MMSLSPPRLSFAFSCLFLSASLTSAAEWWVAPSGSDLNPGTQTEPLATVAAAQRKARDLRRTDSSANLGDLHIYLRGGVFTLKEPLFLRPEDSGSATSRTLIEAAPGERPILSGGVRVTGWRKPADAIPGLPAAAQGKVWIADAPEFNGRRVETRTLWIGERKATRARTPNGSAMERLKSWDRKQETAGIPGALLDGISNVAGVEMIVQQQWEIAVLRVKNVERTSDVARLSFHEPESRIEFEHPWPQPMLPPEGGGAFFLTNHVAFLDQPGEWFQDQASGQILYWPRNDEDLSQTLAVVPALETLVGIDGTLEHPVAYVEFHGIGFQHTTWMRPSQSGHVPLQAGMYLIDGYKLSPKGTPDWPGLDNQAWTGRPPAAVAVRSAEHVRFDGCRFEHLSSTGLDQAWATRDNTIEGCLFRDIGGNGLLVGAFSEGGLEAHLPYNPKDERELCVRERIANNLVDDCANEDWGCVGIGVGFARDVTIEQNEIRNVSYTGISVGWGWTRTLNASRNHRIRANLIHHISTRMCDTAGIYTLSAQPGTEITENVVHSITMSPYVDRPEHWFYLYLDEGSSFIEVRNNLCPEDRFLKNQNGPGNVWENNGPNVSPEVKSRAGLQAPFKAMQTW